MLSSSVQSAFGLLQSTDVVIVFVIIFVTAYIYFKLGIGRQPEETASFRQPPRLTSFPVIGSILHLPAGLRHMHTFFMEKLPTMGPVIGFKIMSRNVVILQTREAIAEAFAKADISDRPFMLFDEKRFEWAAKGISTVNYTAKFRKNHQLALSILKEFGFGELSGVMESRIHDEVAEMIADFEATKSRPTDPARVVHVRIMNVIANILFGRRFGVNDSQAHEFINHNSDLTSTLANASPLMAVPALRHIPYFRSVLGDFETLLRWYYETLKQFIEECENDETESPSFIRSFIEAEGRQSYDKIQLINTLRDLVIAGSETSATTIMWSIVLLANHQDIQARLQKEIDSTVSRERLPSLKDQSQLTFVEAFILELMRYKTVVPLGTVHGVRADAVVQGFVIPAKTMVIPNIYAVHMNPDIWEDPGTFKPERFIDQEGKIVNREKIIPFSIGKRSCLGEQVARQELFLFISGLLQNFDILPPADCHTVDCQEVIGAFIVPSPYSVRFVPRNESNVEPVQA